MSKENTDITVLLQRGDWDKATPLIIEELRGIAHYRLLYLQPGDSLDTNALLHEVYRKLVDKTRLTLQDRAHFFAIASHTMRYTLVNYARKKIAPKRRGRTIKISLEEAGHLAIETVAQELVTLDEALTRLAEFNERQSKVVEFRFFGGFTIEETAKLLSISPSTVIRDWRNARLWLYRSMYEGEKINDTSSETEEIELLPGVESPITLAYCDKPSLRLKGKIRSIQEGESNISIPDEEWDTFYFED